MRAAAHLLLTTLALVAAGCQLGVEARESSCGGDVCADGSECVAERCVPIEPPGTGPDAGAGVPDAAAPEQPEPEPDAAPAAQLVPCDEQFGEALDYNLCVEEPTGCEFFAQTAGQTCAAFCELYGSTCINSWDASPDLPCTRQIEDGCQVAHSTQICLCGRSSQGIGGATAAR